MIANHSCSQENIRNAMYVCICNAVTDRDFRQAARARASSLADLRECLGVATDCGRCAPQARTILNESQEALAPAGGLEPGLFPATA